MRADWRRLVSSLAITNVSQVNKGKLLGQFDLITSDGLRINGVRLLEADGNRWLSFPHREFNRNGARAFEQIITFASGAGRKRFEAEVLLLAEDAICGVGAAR